MNIIRRIIRGVENIQGARDARTERVEAIKKAAASSPARELAWGPLGSADRADQEIMQNQVLEMAQRWASGSFTAGQLYERYIAPMYLDEAEKVLYTYHGRDDDGRPIWTRANASERCFFFVAYEAIGIKAEQSRDREKADESRAYRALAERWNNAMGIFEFNQDNRDKPMGRGGQRVQRPVDVPPGFENGPPSAG